ncbi:MAG: N-formylglutamate amidohydrolase [Pseudomonadota bacterium]
MSGPERGAESIAQNVAEILNPGAHRPTLLVCEHAGVGVPEHLSGLYPDALMRTHYGSDLGSRALTMALAERLTTPAICAHYSRIVIDCNRRLDDPTLFLPSADGVSVAANHSITASDRELRVRGIYAPLHALVESQLETLAQRTHDLLYVAVHSFTPQLGDDPRPWDAGVMWDVDDRVALGAADILRRENGLHIGLNEPYSGRAIQDFSVDFHAERQGFANISIEIRQDHLSDASGVERWADRLAGALEPFIDSPPSRLATATEGGAPRFATNAVEFLETAGTWGVQRAS